FVHEDDGVEVLRRMATEDHPGTFNVAGDGVLLLSQCVRRAGQLSLPIPSPAFSVLGDLARRTGLVDFSTEQLRQMCHGGVVDTAALVAGLGWGRKSSTAAALDGFLRSRGLPGRLPSAVFGWLTEKAGVRR